MKIEDRLKALRPSLVRQKTTNRQLEILKKTGADQESLNRVQRALDAMAQLNTATIEMIVSVTDPETSAIMLEFYSEGHTVHELAKSHWMSPSKVYRHLKLGWEEIKRRYGENTAEMRR